MAGIDILASAFSGANAAFLADLYARWANDPASVDQSFADLFDALNDEARAVLEDASGASWAPRPSFNEPETVAAKPAQGGLALDQVRAAIIMSLRALMLIRSYRVRGHLEAKLDPLGLTKPASHAELDPKTYGFTEADMDKPIFIDNVLGRETATLR
jgi:2-oxoglutarate dehydrogenase E1 component